MISNKFYINALYVSLSILLASCSNTVLAQKAKKKKHHTTDSCTVNVSDYRLKYPEADTLSPIKKGNKESKKNSSDTSGIVLKNEITTEVNKKIDSLSNANKDIKLAEGYRILLYNGGSSEEVKSIKESLATLNVTYRVYDIYKQPVFKVKVGDFLSKIEANKALGELLIYFPNASIITDKVKIKFDDDDE